MPIKIFDISKKLGLENKDVLTKAKALGIVAAKTPSSSLDKITAEYLEEELLKDHPENTTKLFAPIPRATISLSSPKPQITISITSAEIYHLVEKVLHQEIQFHLDVSETELGEPLRLGLIKTSGPRPLVTRPLFDLPVRAEIDERTKDILRAAYFASRHNATEGWVNLAEYGGAIKRLNPTFQPQGFGEKSLGSLLRRVTDLFELRNDESNPIVYYLRMKPENPRTPVTIPSLPKAESNDSRVFAVPIPKLAKGKVHNLKLGFGFILPDDGSENLFFHATDVEGCTIFDLKSGDPVEYEPGMNEKGPCGRKVRRLA